MQMQFEDPSEQHGFAYRNYSDEECGQDIGASQNETGLDSIIEAATDNEWVQSAITFPVLAVAVGAALMMLPLSTNTTSQPTLAVSGVGYDGHDHDLRLQHIVMARMDGPRAFDRASADHKP